MTVFGGYARYYELLYRDKTYDAEAAFVHAILNKHATAVQSVLELGCGNGAHAQHLAERGVQVHGVDRSAEMLERAYVRRSTLSDAVGTLLTFTQGDIRCVRLGRTFDAVIALFHVISYQTRNEDLLGTFATVREHLQPGGIFVFDCWYGPGVLTDRPAVRVKRLEDASVSITRTAEPVMHPNENLVDVNYTIYITDKVSGKTEEIKETHRMRYLFQPEVELLARSSRLEVIEAQEWMTRKEPGFDTWGVCFILRG